MLERPRLGRGEPLARPPLDGDIYVLVGNDCHHRQENGMGNFAWDLTRPDAQPAATTDDGCPVLEAPRPNEEYAIWNAPVTLPISGTVFEVTSDVEDNTPGTPNFDAPDGNMVGIQLDVPGLYLYLLHLERGTVPRPRHDDPETGASVPSTCEPEVPGVRCVALGARLASGTFVGRVGNTGQSVLPHLHVGLLYADTTRSWSVPVEWANVRVDGVPSDFARPGTGQVISQPTP